MRYVAVEPRAAQETIKRLRAAGIARKGVGVLKEPGRVLIPLDDAADVSWVAGLDVVERDRQGTDRPPKNYRELLDLPSAEMRLLPRAFDVVGDVAVLRIEDRIARHATAIARAIVRWNPAIKRVVRDEGVEGELRIRGVRPLIGNSLLTEHRENGLRLMVDLSSVYFSPRLAGERARVASLVGNGERVLDMFAGVGPFSVLIAKTRPDSEVVAVDANPAAVALLEENAALNKVNIKVIPGRAEEVGEGSGHFDRIIMNLPRSGERFLALAFSLLPERGGTIHHYAVLSPEELPPRIVLIESEAARAGFAAKCGPRRLRNFGVGVWIYAIDVVAARL